jgi:hypothetical protein
VSLVNLSVQDVEMLLDEHFDNPLNSPESYNDLKYGGDGNVPGLGFVQPIASYGGEGKGDEYWVVFTITDDSGVTRMFRKDGSYTSCYGNDWDADLREVSAQERVVTVYE